jgi:uncharacterized damage-inducible protein DinB
MTTQTRNPNVSILQNMKQFFDRTTSCFEEKDSEFRPKSEMFTVAQQIAHTAQTIDWFVEGAFRPEGFDLDFEEHMKPVLATKSLTEARAWLDRAMQNAIDLVGSKSEAELAEPLPADGIMGGSPRGSIIGGIADHTAHHRGAIAVYARLLGKVPPMPYS